ncbi:MAG: HAD family hydrolase [Alphaproteobacteria bacterium]|nr:HAD family hydrolase [Alphaproteobacteria bacterium]
MTRADARPRAILFDWDNTLVDNWESVRNGINAALTAFGREPWSYEESRKRLIVSLRDGFPILFGADWKRAMEIFYEAFNARHLETLKPLPGAAELLCALDGGGIYLGVVSNKTGPILRREAKHLGWNRHFGQIVGATDASVDKPAPDPVFMALAGSSIAAGPEVWLVGDAATDLECAHRAGCRPVLVRETPPGEGEFGVFAPALHVVNCHDLAHILGY